MLVLSRKQTEVIRIGDDIVVKVIYAGKGSVKIGIEAPGDVRVKRGEVTLEGECVAPSCPEGEGYLKQRLAQRRQLQPLQAGAV